MKPVTTFLSHNSEDKSLIEQLGYKLLSKNITPWIDKWNLIPGDPWQEAIEDALDECDNCIVFFGKNGVGPWQNEEMRVAIQKRVEDKAKQFKVIPVLLPGAKKTTKLPSFLKRATWIEFSDDIEEEVPFELLLHGILGTPPYPTSNKGLNPNKYRQDIEHIYSLLGGKLIKTKYCNESRFCVNFSKGPLKFSIHVICFLSNTKEKLLEKNMKDIFIEWSSYSSSLDVDKVVVVSNVDISEAAKEFSFSKKIEVIKLEDLLNQLVNFDDYLELGIKSFEKSDLGKFYIDQTGSDLEDYETIKLTSFDDYLHKPLVSYIDDLFFKNNNKRIALLGNFGVGKTVFCKYYYYTLLKKYKEDKSNRIPVYLNLKDFRSGLDIHQVLINQLQKQPGIEISYNLFLELQRLGRFIFILDSLDEMATKVDRIVINENLRELDRLLEDGNNLYLISCRTHFFHEKITENILDDYEVVFLTEWGREELEEYFKIRFPKNWKSQLRSFDEIKGLEDLSKTPMFLEMIIKSISSIKDEKDFNLTKLFKAYTSDWINQQSKRRGAIMSAKQREDFTVSLASILYLEDISEIHFSKLHRLAQEISGYRDATRIDYFDTDARTSTFLTKSSDGLYGFRHRSFLEYFTSVSIVNSIEVGDETLISIRSLPKEILFFLEHIPFTAKNLDQLQEWSLDFKSKFKSRNSISVLKLKGETLNKEVIEHYKIDKSEWDLFDNSKTNDQALEELYNKYYSEMISMGRNLANNYNLNMLDVEDAIQEAILMIWSKKDHSRLEKYSVRSYLYSLLRNMLMQKSRLKDRNMEFSLDQEFILENIVDESASMSEHENKEDIEKRLIELIDELDDNSKLVVKYFYLDKYSSSEIAKLMNKSEPVIKQIKYRAMKKLRILGQNDDQLNEMTSR